MEEVFCLRWTTLLWGMTLRPMHSGQMDGLGFVVATSAAFALDGANRRLRCGVRESIVLAEARLVLRCPDDLGARAGYCLRLRVRLHSTIMYHYSSKSGIQCLFSACSVYL